MLLNSDWTQNRAGAFADRLARESGSDPEARIRLGYELALGRGPAPEELRMALEFLGRQSQAHHKIVSRITFRPDVPNSLFGDYMKQLQPADFLHGPTNGWRYFHGRWSAAYEGIRTLDRQRGPFALWSGQRPADGTLLCRIVVHPACESASLLIRSHAEHQEQRGYEILLDPRQHRLQLKRHSTEVEVVAETPALIPMGTPLAVKVDFAGPRIRIWLAGAAEEFTGQPALDATDAKPILATGWVGVRCVGAALSVDALALQSSGNEIPIVPSVVLANQSELAQLTPQRAELCLEPRAWQSFCLLLLNLNEFIYVD